MKNRLRKIQINSTNSYREFAIIFMVFYPVHDLNNRYYELVIFVFTHAYYDESYYIILKIS